MPTPWVGILIAKRQAMKYAEDLFLAVWLVCATAAPSKVVQRTDFRLNDGLSSGEYRPRVTGDVTFAIDWVDRRNTSADIFLRRIGSDSFSIGSNTAVSNNSTIAVPVRLDVTAPNLELSADTLSLCAFAGLDVAVNAPFTVVNAGAGEMSWSAFESADWLTLSTYAGNAGDQVDIRASAAALVAGFYSASVAFDGGTTINSPDTLWVLLEVRDNLPYLTVVPDSVALAATQPHLLDTFLVVSNAGDGIISWTASSDQPWLRLNRASGIGDDTIRLSIDTAGLLPGIQSGSIEVVDSGSLNTCARAAFTLDYLMPGLDTVIIESARVVDGATELNDPDNQLLPVAFQLCQNYPNPFNAETVVEFDLPARSAVQLEVFNILGQRARLLADGDLPPGHHRAAWDGLLESGREAPSGIYFYRLRGPKVSLVRKMVLLR